MVELTAEYFRSLSKEQRKRVLSAMSERDCVAILYDWKFWARPNQRPPPGEWVTWLLLAGRGFGKTRTAAEWVRSKAEQFPGCRIALVNDTAADTRDVMVEGKSGLLAVSPPWCRPVYEPSKRRVTWPNGSMAILYAAEAPELLRGPEHDFAWCDEPAKWKNLRKSDAEGGTAWDNLMMGLRSGANPQCAATTTPRPIKWVKDLVKDQTTRVSRGSSYDNRDNLAPAFFDLIVRKYEGTRLGRQELNAEILDDNPGALWKRSNIDEHRVSSVPCDLVRIVVAVDPAVTSNENSAETGIIVAGRGRDGRGYVLDDRSLSDKPAKWAGAVVAAMSIHHADRIIGEVNNGGDLVESTIRTVQFNAPYKAVRASRGKEIRAEPIAALYEQGRISHVGSFPELEDQLCDWDPTAGMSSPDRLDALVWAFTELFSMSGKPPQSAGSRVFSNASVSGILNKL